mmetsp:Transcript_65048/g.141776  ORF Transcript_65048/g.141776 Transcript_65048/m.141776 type:complete len:227 (+) Transcript_65048:164-844(+)
MVLRLRIRNDFHAGDLWGPSRADNVNPVWAGLLHGVCVLSILQQSCRDGFCRDNDLHPGRALQEHGSSLEVPGDIVLERCCEHLPVRRPEVRLLPSADAREELQDDASDVMGNGDSGQEIHLLRLARRTRSHSRCLGVPPLRQHWVFAFREQQSPRHALPLHVPCSGWLYVHLPGEALCRAPDFEVQPDAVHQSGISDRCCGEHARHRQLSGRLGLLHRSSRALAR